MLYVVTEANLPACVVNALLLMLSSEVMHDTASQFPEIVKFCFLTYFKNINTISFFLF